MSVAWTPDGREVVYSVHEPQGGRIWRIAWNAKTPGRGTPLAGQTGDANFVSISRPGSNRPVRLAYQVENLDIGMRLVDLTAVSGAASRVGSVNMAKIIGRADFFLAVAGSDRFPCLLFDILVDEPNRAVGEQHVHTTGMVATRRGEHVDVGVTRPVVGTTVLIR